MPEFNEDMFDGLNHLGMLPDAETAQKYLTRGMAFFKMVKQWWEYLRQLVTSFAEQMFSVFGIKNSVVEKSAKKVVYKTWLAVQEELPQNFKDLYVQFEQVSDYLTSGFDVKRMSKLMDFMH